MKSKIKLMLLLLIFLSFALLSCSTANDKANFSNQTQNSNKIEIYADLKDWNAKQSDEINIETINTAITLNSAYSSKQNNNYSLNAYVKIKNLDSSRIQFTLNKINLIRESTNTNYTIKTNIFSDTFELDSLIETSIGFSSLIPTSIDEENYVLSFILNDFKVIMHLYETPDSLRVDRIVDYFINDSKVNTETVKNGRTLTNKYVYESKDHLYYCEKWYNEDKENISTNTKITKDLKIYGTLDKNIKFTSFSTDVYTFVTSVNHIPSDGVLIIPQTDNGKEISISNYALYNLNAKYIYIPKTTHCIYGGNFTNMPNTIIFYEGNATQWAALFFMSSDIVTKNVVYNTKAPTFN